MRQYLITGPPKATHVAPLPTRKDFKPNKMKAKMYSLEGISAAIVDHLNRSENELTKRQKKAMAKYKNHGTWNLGRPLSLKSLQMFHRIPSNW